MKSFFNRVLRVDPAVSRYTYEDLPDEALRRTLGGKGLGADTDKLPKRSLKEKNGEGASFSKEDLEIMLEEHNRIRKERSQKELT